MREMSGKIIWRDGIPVIVVEGAEITRCVHHHAYAPLPPGLYYDIACPNGHHLAHAETVEDALCVLRDAMHSHPCFAEAAFGISTACARGEHNFHRNDDTIRCIDCEVLK